MEEVATSEVTASATPVTETAAPATETTGAERSDFTDSVGFDINQVPENIRGEVEKYGKKWEKEFKSAYTRKTQELSARERSRDAQVTQAMQRARDLEGILSDPKKVEAYLQLTSQQANKPEFQTVEELVSYTKNEAVNAARSEFQREVEAMKGTDRWSKAFESAKSKAPTPEIANLAASLAMSDTKYRQHYTGNNEADILQMALDDTLNMLKPALEKTRQEALSTVEKKKAASTLSPSKTVTPGGSKKLSADEIIAKVNSLVPR